MVGITLETSLKAVIIATLAGFFIFYLPFSQLFNTGKVQNLHKAVTAPEKEQRTKLDLIDSALKEQLKLYHISKEEPTTSGLLNRTNFVEALYAVKNYIRHGKSSSLSFASNMLKSIGFNIANIDSKYIYIYDILPNSFRGIFAFSLNPEINHTLVVLHPRQNPGLLAAALGMFEKYSFAGIAIAGINRNDNKTSMFTHESNSEALFYSYINYTSSSLPPVFMFLRNGKIDNAIKRDNPDINLNSKFSYIRKPGKNYMAIYQKLNPILVDTVNIDNNPDRLFPYFPNPDKFMSIYLSDNGLLDIMKLSPYTSGQVPVIKTAPLTQKSVFSSLNSFIKNFFKGKKNKSEHLVKLNYQMGNYIDKQIISPILDTTSWKNPNLLTQLNIISVAAKIANLSITLHIIPDQKENKFVSLKPADTNYENELFLFNAANYSPYIIIEEPPSTGESLSLAVFIAQQLNARALFIPDSIIKDKSAVFTEAQTNYEYKKTLLYLVAQVTIRKMDQYYREHNKKVPDNCITNNIIQFRSIESEALNSTSENTVFISTNTGAYNLGLLTPDQLKVYRLLKKVGLKVAFVDGRKQTAGMEACNLLTYNYLSETSNTNFMVIWFPSKMVLKF